MKNSSHKKLNTSLEVPRRTLEEALEISFETISDEEDVFERKETKAIKTIIDEKLPFKFTYRRKSCHCTWCGGIPSLQKDIEKNPLVNILEDWEGFSQYQAQRREKAKKERTRIWLNKDETYESLILDTKASSVRNRKLKSLTVNLKGNFKNKSFPRKEGKNVTKKLPRKIEITELPEEESEEFKGRTKKRFDTCVPRKEKLEKLQPLKIQGIEVIRKRQIKSPTVVSATTLPSRFQVMDLLTSRHEDSSGKIKSSLIVESSQDLRITKKQKSKPTFSHLETFDSDSLPNLEGKGFSQTSVRLEGNHEQNPESTRRKIKSNTNVQRKIDLKLRELKRIPEVSKKSPRKGDKFQKEDDKLKTKIHFKLNKILQTPKTNFKTSGNNKDGNSSSSAILKTEENVTERETPLKSENDLTKRRSTNILRAYNIDTSRSLVNLPGYSSTLETNKYSGTTRTLPLVNREVNLEKKESESKRTSQIKKAYKKLEKPK